jgi:hypothetical protein
VGLIQRATVRDQEAFISALLDLDPALLHRRPPPTSQAIEFAFTYEAPHPLLTRIWPMPDDLPHAAGMGDLARVKHWFDAAGKPALGDLARHFLTSSAQARNDLQWGAPNVQQVLDIALAWAVLNSHFEVADFLLAHGADINTRWSSHEPASILHELAGLHENYAAMQFLIDRGIDLTIVDYRWGGTADGWARHAAKNETMAQWLAAAERLQAGSDEATSSQRPSAPPLRAAGGSTGFLMQLCARQGTYFWIQIHPARACAPRGRKRKPFAMTNSVRCVWSTSPIPRRRPMASSQRWEPPASAAPIGTDGKATTPT